MPLVLFIGGLHPDTRARDLAHSFERFGPLVRCDILTPNPNSDFNSKSSTSKAGSGQPYAFIEFRSERDAQEARERMHECVFEGNRLSVQYAKNPRPIVTSASIDAHASAARSQSTRGECEIHDRHNPTRPHDQNTRLYQDRDDRYHQDLDRWHRNHRNRSRSPSPPRREPNPDVKTYERRLASSRRLRDYPDYGNRYDYSHDRDGYGYGHGSVYDHLYDSEQQREKERGRGRGSRTERYSDTVGSETERVWTTAQRWKDDQDGGEYHDYRNHRVNLHHLAGHGHYSDSDRYYASHTSHDRAYAYGGNDDGGREARIQPQPQLLRAEYPSPSNDSPRIRPRSSSGFRKIGHSNDHRYESRVGDSEVDMDLARTPPMPSFSLSLPFYPSSRDQYTPNPYCAPTSSTAAPSTRTPLDHGHRTPPSQDQCTPNPYTASTSSTAAPSARTPPGHGPRTPPSQAPNPYTPSTSSTAAPSARTPPGHAGHRTPPSQSTTSPPSSHKHGSQHQSTSSTSESESASRSGSESDSIASSLHQEPISGSEVVDDRGTI